MTIIQQGATYILSFTIKGDPIRQASGVKALFTLSPDLDLVGLSSSVGIVNGLNPNEWIIGTLLPNQQVTINVDVEVLNEVSDLEVTVNFSTTSNEVNLSNNTETQNLVTELAGILCEEIGTCAGNLAILPTNQLPIYDNAIDADGDLATGEWGKWSVDNTEGIPSILGFETVFQKS